VTADDVKNANLVLFGGPESNAIAARIAKALPLDVAPGKILFHGKTYEGPRMSVRFIYPNPENPERYVLVNCGVTPEAMRGIDFSSRGAQPDWLVFEGKTAAPGPRTAPGERVPGAPASIEGGFFDRDWK
jgi:hypothetical protein